MSLGKVTTVNSLYMKTNAIALYRAERAPPTSSSGYLPRKLSTIASKDDNDAEEGNAAAATESSSETRLDGLIEYVHAFLP